MKTAYSIAFTRNDSPSKMLNFNELLSSPAEAKTKVSSLRRQAKIEGYKNFGKSWDYMAVAITPLR
jgi:hypothetical protein